MKYVLAISGGVDSAVLLDMFAKRDAIVAHFDHGIRKNSAADAKFVKNLAARYEMKFVLGKGQLEKNASEETARRVRYEFLHKVTQDKIITTAHHQDDLIETILINLIRGTGWRGLAPFWSSDIERPLLKLTKAEIIAYAIDHDLEWVEDETNFSYKYFRNRVRDLVVRMPSDQRQRLLILYKRQAELRSEIEKILESANLDVDINQITKLPTDVAVEILRKVTHTKLTTPQLKRLLKNLRNAKSGQIFQPGGKIQIGVYHNQITISEL